MLILKKISICLFLFFITISSKAEEEWYSFEPAEVTLSGRIIYQDFFGPPNYGENPETDLVETAVILVLYEPINVKGDPEKDYNSQIIKNIKKIQLVVPWEKIGDENLSGKNVTAHGTLFEAITGHHRTQVLMAVDDLEIKSEE